MRAVCSRAEGAEWLFWPCSLSAKTLTSQGGGIVERKAAGVRARLNPRERNMWPQERRSITHPHCRIYRSCPFPGRMQECHDYGLSLYWPLPP